MPKAKNGDISIRYEVEGKGPPLLFHHGLTSCLEIWGRETGYVDSLKNDYQLILMDARGHGESDKPHDPQAYAMEQRVGDVTAVLDDLGIKSTHFFGYSYGGRVGFELAKLVPERVRSLIIGGAGARVKKPGPEGLRQIQLWEKVPQEVLKGLVATFEKASPISRDAKTRLLANDPNAIIAIMKSSPLWLDLEDDLPGMTIPFLIFVGEADPAFPAATEASRRLPNVTYVSLPGLDHLQTAFSNLMLPHIKKFLARVSKS
jgi:pimeloyl-ACP methyl ester carboxylesterase